MDERIRRHQKVAVRFLVTILVACAASVCAVTPHAVSADRDLYIRYFETSEGTYTEIVVTGRHLRVRYFDNASGRCARWIEQRPCWTEADLRLAESELASAQRDDLMHLIDTSRFVDLDPSYGGAADGQRFYPIEIAVRLGDEERRVVYRAFPGAGPMPDGFAHLRARLEGLAQVTLGRDTPP